MSINDLNCKCPACGETFALGDALEEQAVEQVRAELSSLNNEELAQKLENASSLEAANNELIIEGVLFMQEGGNPRVLADMLASFVSPKSREKLSTA